MQLSVEEARTTMKLNVMFGYGYHDIISNRDMIEFHMDYWSPHQQEAVAKDIANSMPLMIIGQGESVIAQYLLGSKTWVVPKGQHPLLPAKVRRRWLLDLCLCGKRVWLWARDDSNRISKCQQCNLRSTQNVP